MTDTRKIFKTLTDTGMPAAHADGIVDVLNEMVATKDDLDSACRELKQESMLVRSELKNELAVFRAEVRADLIIIRVLITIMAPITIGGILAILLKLYPIIAT